MPKTHKEHDELLTVRLPEQLKGWMRDWSEEVEMSLSEGTRCALEIFRAKGNRDPGQAVFLDLPDDIRAWAERTAEAGGLGLATFLAWAIGRVRKEWIEKGLVWRSRPTP